MEHSGRDRTTSKRDNPAYKSTDDVYLIVVKLGERACWNEAIFFFVLGKILTHTRTCMHGLKSEEFNVS